MLTTAISSVVMMVAMHYHGKQIIPRGKIAAAPLPPPPRQGPNFQEYMKANKSGQITDKQQQWVRDYSRMSWIKSPLPGIVPNFCLVADPAVAKALTIGETNNNRPRYRFQTRTEVFARAVRDSVGDSLAGTTGEEWKWRRTAFLKEMHKSKLFSSPRKLLEQIFAVGESLCEKLDEAAGTGLPVKTDILATEAALDTILFFLFGKVLKGYNADEIRQGAKDTLSYLFESLLDPLFHLKKNFSGTTANEELKNRNAAWDLFDSLVKEEVEIMIQEAKGERERASDRLPGSILESWLQAEPRFYERSLDPILSEVRGMILAGFETTAHALSYSFGMLAERPDLADQLYEVAKPIMEDVASKETNFSTALDKTAVVKSFFMEALRLYPLAPALSGDCTEDIIVHSEGTEYGLPKGTTCIFLNFAMQRHPEYCKGSQAPDVIEPERWMPPTSSPAASTPPSSLPFLHTFNNGPHTCPGKPLSLLEGHIFLLQIACRFQFQFPEGIKKVQYDEQLLLRPKDAMPLIVSRR